MDDPQHPIGVSRPGVTGTGAPAAEPAAAPVGARSLGARSLGARSLGARSLGPADFPGQSAQWPGRRVLRPGERALVCVGAGVLTIYLVALLASADWRAHPALAAVTTVSGGAAVVALTASAWVRRPDHGVIWGRPLRWVPRPLRRDLARDLRAGRPGPPELRPAAVDWTCQTLQAPWSLALPLAVLANAAGSLTRPGPTATWQLLVLTVFVVGFALLFGLELVRRRAAHQVADTLERLTGPSPRLPDPA